MLSLFKKKEEVKPNGFTLGNWEVEVNEPYGFIVKSTVDIHCQYHFLHDSNGWMTSLVKRKKEKQLNVLNAFGKLGGQAILVDKESAAKYARFIELQKKGEKLTEEEMKELLQIMGVMGG